MSTLTRLILIACLVCVAAAAEARDIPAKAKALAKPTDKVSVAWQNDPTCQFVFFAVLEGLYKDGVQDEIVDLIVAPENADKRQRSNVEHCFVFKCELCHAVYEAFVLYKRRQAFANSKGKTTFGKGVDPNIVAALKSERPQPRVYAMGELIRPWIQRRIEQQRLTRDEQADLAKRIAEYAREGGDLLNEMQRDKNTVYIDWNFYGTCQACEAAKDISENLNRR
jgi:hypothetical protein